jgi:DNA-binding MarR family transcriptional regulator
MTYINPLMGQPKRGLPYNDLKWKLLDLIKKHPGISSGDIYRFIKDGTPDTISRHIKQLEVQGLIVKFKAEGNKGFRHYHQDYKQPST